MRRAPARGRRGLEDGDCEKLKTTQNFRRVEQNGCLLDRVAFHGHPMISALHPRTIEVTTEEHLTERGDCIIGVGADKGCAGLSSETKRALRVRGAKLKFRIFVEGENFEVSASGDPALTLTHQRDIVLRRSSFVSGRTVAVRANCAAADLPRRLVKMLTLADARGMLEILVIPT